MRTSRNALFIFICAVFLITACSPQDGGPDPAPTETGAVVVEPTATLTPPPTQTATPLPDRALFFAPAETEDWLIAQLEGAISQLAAGSGLVLERTQDLDQEEITENTRMVVAVPGGADLGRLAEAHPNTAFIAVGYPGLTERQNLSVIGPQGFRPDQQGFVAGNLAAMQTEDWRVGVVSVGDTVEGQAGRNGFLNGAVFFCGLCRPAFPPFVLYPTFSDVPSAADESAWQAAAQALLGEAVQTVYIYTAADSPSLRQNLTEAGITLITGPTGEAGIQPNVIARIVPNPAAAVELVWPEMLNGMAGRTIAMPIAVQDINPDLMSQGRLVHITGIIDDLINGVTDTGIDPQTAEPR